MRKSSITFLWLLLLVPFTYFSQIKISGIVLDKNTKKSIPYTSIAVYDTKNHLVSGTSSLDNGSFNLELSKPANYKFEFSNLSFKTFNIQKNITADYTFGKIFLEENLSTLGEIEFEIEKSPIELQLDKLVYNVSKDLAASGESASEVLNKVPSVNVDVEGNVSLRGNESIRVLINGKPSGLLERGAAEALNQIPANSIERIEVITNPSARYSAEGGGGVINIVLKNNKKFNPQNSITAVVGNPNNYRLNFQLNQSHKKFFFYTDMSINYRDNTGEVNSDQTVIETQNRLISDRTIDRSRFSHNFIFGTDYEIDTTSSIGLNFTYLDARENNISSTDFTELQNFSDLNEITFRQDDEDEYIEHIETTLTYNKKIENKENHKLDFAANFYTNNDDEFSDFINQETFPNRTDLTDERVENIETENGGYIQLDYNFPFLKNIFELGYRSTFLDKTNDYIAEEFVNGDFQVIEDFENELNFRQNVHAFYSQINYKWSDKFSTLAGLRWEQTDINIQDFNIDTSKNFNNLFPSFSLQYNFDEDHQLTFGINRRIRRPNSRFLNPFPTFSNNRARFEGNPDLNPVFTYNYEIKFLKYLGDFTLQPSLYYRNMEDIYIFDLRIREDEEGFPITIIQPINSGEREVYGMEFFISYNKYKFLTASTEFNFNRRVQYRTIDGEFDASNFIFRNKTNISLSLPKNYTFQTYIFYVSGQTDNLRTREPIFFMNASVGKKIGERWNLSLAVQDIFNSRFREITSTENDILSNNLYRRQFRQINLSATYKFGHSDSKKKRKRNRSSFMFEEDAN